MSSSDFRRSAGWLPPSYALGVGASKVSRGEPVVGARLPGRRFDRHTLFIREANDLDGEGKRWPASRGAGRRRCHEHAQRAVNRRHPHGVEMGARRNLPCPGGGMASMRFPVFADGHPGVAQPIGDEVVRPPHGGRPEASEPPGSSLIWPSASRRPSPPRHSQRRCQGQLPDGCCSPGDQRWDVVGSRRVRQTEATAPIEKQGGRQRPSRKIIPT